MSPQSAPSPDAREAVTRRKAPIFRWIGAAALVAAAAGIYLWQTHIPPIHTVAVRPFTDATGQSWVAGAITEEIAEALRAGTQPAGVDAVLDGTVARAGDRIRVTATLSRVDGHRYWSRTFERPLAEIADD